MRLMNNVVIMRGTMGTDITYRQDQNGQVRSASFAIYVFKPGKKDGDKDDIFNCVLFGKDAQDWASGSAKRIPAKGDEVVVGGSIHNGRDYTDKDGIKRYGRDSIYCNDVYVARTKAERNGQGTASAPVKEFTRQTVPVTPAPAPQNQDFMEIPEGLEDEIPFI